MRRWVTVSALILAVPLLLLLLGEAALRLFWPQDPFLELITEETPFPPAPPDTPIYWGDPDVGLLYTPNLKFVQTNREYSVHFRINSTGFRGEELATLATSGKPVIELTGDSMLAGLGVEEDQRVGNLLAQDLPQYTWLNFGLPATGIEQHLNHWRKFGKPFSPRLVIEFMTYNDLMDGLLGYYHFPKPHFELKGDGQLVEIPPPPPLKTAQKRSPPFRSLRRYLRERSHLFVLIKHLLHPWPEGQNIYNAFRKERSKSWDYNFRLYLAVLAHYAEEVRASGAEFAFVGFALKPAVNTSEFYKAYDWERTIRYYGWDPADFDPDAIEKALLECGREHDFPVLSLLPDYRRLDKADDPIFYPVDLHMTPRGNRLTVDLFIEKFWPELEKRMAQEPQGGGSPTAPDAPSTP